MHGKRVAGLPLHLLVSGAIVAGMLILATILILNSYNVHRQTLIKASGNSARQLADNLDTHLERLLEPIDSTLQILTLDPITRATSLETRRTRLPVLVRAVESTPILSAVYVGYRDGSFMLLRKLNSRAARSAVQAPDGATYLLQSIERSEAGEIISANWHFYNRERTLLEVQQKQDYRFDPRERPWYRQAEDSLETILTPPYLFYTTGEIGVTMARRNPINGTVIGVDASVDDLSILISTLQSTPGNEMAVVTDKGQVVAYPKLDRIIRVDTERGLRLANLDELGVPVLEQVARLRAGEMGEFTLDKEGWYGMVVPMSTSSRAGLRLLFAVPERELLAGAKEQSLNQVLWSGLAMLVLMLIGSKVGRVISQPLTTLSERIDALAAFDFSHSLHENSKVREVNQLGYTIDRMSRAISNFQTISRTLARERDLDLLVSRVTDNLVAITGAKAGMVYLYDDQNKTLRAASAAHPEWPGELACSISSVREQCDLVKAALDKKGVAVMATGLSDRQGDALGVLTLRFSEGSTMDEESFRRFVDEVSGSAATAIETRRQVETQQALIDAIIRLLADAIDAKSPYTSGHCERVPQLAAMLVDAAQDSKQEPFARFRMSETERQEFRIAAWLHDCGKVTSPEYVVDKATKLETIYNRIHEVRTRFEVLWRDAQIDYLKGVVEGGDEATLRHKMERIQRELQAEFAFVASSNTGGEFMPDEAIERLHKIAQRHWVRHFDNRLGLSREEYDRMPPDEPPPPVREPLLSDRPEHCVAWGNRRPPVEKDHPDNRWGFDMPLPQHAFNYGELYNLSVQKGTLNDEERFIINDHIVQTIRMLSALPLPKELRRVPDIAGNHHEKMDGNGYPRRLSGEQLSIPERVMALADVFEALTAADRPYKDAKTLSESLRILAFMVKDQHIDQATFELFLESGVYLRYAERFLSPEQIDAVDKRQLLALARG
ncbi:MAG: phosphohydrolase [Oceanospirillaceae bacterium]|nr:phosphohydrolase [Oceanospirillaceae bacterium]